MVKLSESSNRKKQFASVNLTDAQFDELKKLLRDYLKITAIAAIGDTSEDALERNTRILDAAGYTQEEIGRILHSSQSKISRVLAGVRRGKKNGGKRK